MWDLSLAGRVIASLHLRDQEVVGEGLEAGVKINARFDQITVSKLDDVRCFDDQPAPGTLRIRERDGVASLQRTG